MQPRNKQNQGIIIYLYLQVGTAGLCSVDDLRIKMNNKECNTYVPPMLEQVELDSSKPVLAGSETTGTGTIGDYGEGTYEW